MHTVELLEEALTAGERLGFRIRHEWLGGTGGGACEFAGQKWIFVDLALNTVEQLDQVCEALRADPGIFVIELSPEMRRLVGTRRAA